MFDNPKLFLNASFFLFASEIDIEFAEIARKNACPYCKHVLHYARYERKGRTINDEKLPADWGHFHSLCCSNGKCRKRVRPTSIRFAGRSPFSVAFYLLAELIQSGGSERSICKLSKELSVSERTIGRWLSLWKRIYSGSVCWRKISSIWIMNGKGLDSLSKLVFSVKQNLKETFEELLKINSELWNEINLFGSF